MVRARGVAEAQLYHFAAESPGGPSVPITCTCTTSTTCDDHKNVCERPERKLPLLLPKVETPPVVLPGYVAENEYETALDPGSATKIYPPQEVQFEMSKEDVFEHCLVGHARYDSPRVARTAPVLAHFDSPDAVVCPCGEDHSDSAWEALGSAGLADSGSERAPDISGHEVYCGCDDCHATPPCAGCGRTCDDDFCFCPPTCAICGGDGTDLSLEQFTFTIEPGTLPPGDYQECFSPDMLTAFWDDGELTVADTQSDARWRFVYFEPQNRQNSPTSRQYYTWYCKRIGVANPCDENFMKAISS